MWATKVPSEESDGEVFKDQPRIMKNLKKKKKL